MGPFLGIWLFVLGGLGAASLVARRPEGRKALGALEPYQGWIGALSVLGGVWTLVTALFAAGLLPWWGLGWLLRVAVGVLLIALGLVLGVGVLDSFFKSPSAQARLERWTRSVQPYRERLGIVAMVLGAYLILRGLL